METPPEKLNFRNSEFALMTFKERWPVILAQTIDSLCRHRKFYEETEGISGDQIKALISLLAHLRYEVTTDKPIILLSANLGRCNDTKVWNNLLRTYGISTEGSLQFTNGPTWFILPWMLTECYLYRRIAEAVSLSGLGSFDPFALKKQAALKNCQDQIYVLLKFLSQSPEGISEHGCIPYFEIFLQTSLWANEFDLSLHTESDYAVSAITALPDFLRKMQPKVVVNDTDKLISLWMSRREQASSCESDTGQHTTAFILDNAGFELVADFCLAEFLLTNKLTDRVRFYPKSLPWFVSDVTVEDIEWTLHTGLKSKSLKPPLSEIVDQWSEKWRTRFTDGTFVFESSKFWTLPCVYEELYEIDRELYNCFTRDLNAIIFKGDLNYRKLLGDRSWAPDKPEAKIEAFRPMQLGRAVREDGKVVCNCSDTLNPLISPGDAIDCHCPNTLDNTLVPPLVLALRIAKADVAVGLTPRKLNNLLSVSNSWWTDGAYGMVQIVSPIKMS